MPSSQWAYLQLRRLLAEVRKGIPQGMLCLYQAVEVVGESPRELQHTLVLALCLPEQLNLCLQLQVHGAGAPAKPLRDQLLGTLQGEGGRRQEVPGPWPTGKKCSLLLWAAGSCRAVLTNSAGRSPDASSTSRCSSPLVQGLAQPSACCAALAASRAILTVPGSCSPCTC